MVAMHLTTFGTYPKLLLLIDVTATDLLLPCDFVTLLSSNIQHIHQYSYFEFVFDIHFIYHMTFS